MNIHKRIKIENENWYLYIDGEKTLEIDTMTKRERKILNAIRKVLNFYGFEKRIDLTNREKYVKNLNVSQEKLMQMKANDKFKEIELNKNLPSAWDIVRDSQGFKKNPKTEVLK